MIIEEFEAKVKEIIEKSKVYVPYNETDECVDWFNLHITSRYKKKSLYFSLDGKNPISFNVYANSYDKLFTNALVILKKFCEVCKPLKEIKKENK